MTQQQGFGPAWLVVVRTNLDDLPIGLYSSEKAAVQRAKRVSVADANKAAKFMGVDNAGRINTAVIGFDEHGRPQDLQLLIKQWRGKSKKTA